MQNQKNRTRIIAIGIQLMMITAVLGAGGYRSELTGPYAFYQSNEEMTRFFSAKEYIFKRQWSEARTGLEAYLRQYPAGQLRDEALYWLAMSLDKLSLKQISETRVVELKELAVTMLTRLCDDFPKSLWKDDALKMKTEIILELSVLLGSDRHDEAISEILGTTGKSELEMKLDALGSLIELSPETAIPALKRIIDSEQNAKIRAKAVMLLGRRYSSEVVRILEKAAALDEDESVRREASYWIDQIRIRMIPVQLNYYAFAVRLEGGEQQNRVPENLVSSFSLPPCDPHMDEARRSIQKFFSNRLTGFSSVASSRGFSFSAGSRIGHNINDFYLSVLGNSIEKRIDRISGKLFVQDKVSDRQFTEDFVVDKRNDMLLAARRGDRMFVMLFQFESTAPKGGDQKVAKTDLSRDPIDILEKVFDLGERPVYYTETNMENGLKVLSSLKTSDYSRLKNMHDFGLAKAEIPTESGTWAVTGYLLYQRSEKRFLARMAVLMNPEDQAVAVADQIIVPLDNPAEFKVLGSRVADSESVTVKSQKKTDQVDPAHSRMVLTPERVTAGGYEFMGWFVKPAAGGMPSIEASQGDKVDFGLASAEKKAGQGSWILTGYMILDKQKQRFIVVNGRLTGPGGEIILSAEIISVPVDDPAKAKKYDIKLN